MAALKYVLVAAEIVALIAAIVISVLLADKIAKPIAETVKLIMKISDGVRLVNHMAANT